MRPLWFKAKRYGWGWYPATWQGWLIFGVVSLAILIYVFAVPIDPEATVPQVMLYLVPVWIAALVLVIICWMTGETPRWRWGGR